MKAIIFDCNRTIYDPDSQALHSGALEALEQLSAQYTLFLVAKGGAERKKLIESLGIERFFRAVLVQEEKNAQQFRECQQLLDPATSWFVVGDRVTKEIAYGNQCGMKTIWFRNGKFAEEVPQNEEETPHHIIQELSEIAAIVAAEHPQKAAHAKRS